MAFAALFSLDQILEQILHPDRFLILHHKLQIESLREKICFLLTFLEDSSQKSSESMECLETKIRDAAYQAEDIIETHILDQFRPGKSSFSWRLGVNLLQKSVAVFQILMPSLNVFDRILEHRHDISWWNYRDLEKVAEEMDSIVKEAMKIKEGYGREDLRSTNTLLAGPSKLASLRRNISMVGFDDDLTQIKDRLTGSPSKLEVISILGMGGTGKTTLARNVYDDPLIVHHFHIRAWITISQEYHVRDILLKLLDSLRNLTDKMHHQSEFELAEHIYKILRPVKYLIVMDDVWNNKAWNDFRRLFPDISNGSRVLLTTRIKDVASYAGSNSSPHQMRFLDDNEGWELLSAEVFGKECCCPSELEEIGQEIAEKCRGLPLTIVVIGGLLSKLDWTYDVWETVATNIHSITATADNRCSEILSLSYNHLPQRLKACFLYMGIFPEDYQIRVSNLIRLWGAEGFLKQVSPKSIEEAGKEYLEDLVSRNLVQVIRRRIDGKIRTIEIHDLLRDLCVRESEKEKFLHILHHNEDETTFTQRRLSLCLKMPRFDPFFHSLPNSYQSTRSVSLARTLLYTGRQFIPSRVFLGLRLLRVLHMIEVLLFSFPTEIVKLVNLRYLAFSYHGEIPSSISKLWNLQTLILGPLVKSFALFPRPLPPEIWMLPRLRHLRFNVWFLSEPPCELIGWGNYALLANLQTLSEVNASFCMKEVLQQVPNLRKLGIWMEKWEPASFYVNNLVYLQQLEVLKCRVIKHSSVPEVFSPVLPRQLSFPPTLKELTLSGCRIPWEDMSVVGSLQNLEVLKLRDYAFVGSVWEPTEGEFCRLKFLLIEETDLVHWRADNTHFPSLQMLVVFHCWKLEEIPSGIGDISTLEMIKMDKSSRSAANSAEQLIEEQQWLGNYRLELRFL